MLNPYVTVIIGRILGLTNIHAN